MLNAEYGSKDYGWLLRGLGKEYVDRLSPEGLAPTPLPHSLERIGSWAFDYCPQLHTVEYCGSIAEWDALEKGDCFLPEQFQNELERIDRPFALTAGEHCIIRAEEMAPEPTPQHSTEADYELELE